jgi:hypothetical protein
LLIVQSFSGAVATHAANPPFFIAVDLVADGSTSDVTRQSTQSITETAGGTVLNIEIEVGDTFGAPGLGTVTFDLNYTSPHVQFNVATWTVIGGYLNGDGGAVSASCAVNNTTQLNGASLACNLPGALTGPTAAGVVATASITVCKTADGNTDPLAPEPLGLGLVFPPELSDVNGNAYDPLTLIDATITCTGGGAPPTSTFTPTSTSTATPTNTPLPTNTPCPLALCTATPFVRATITPTPTVTVVATGTTAPAATPPAGTTGAPGTQPDGRPAGAIRLPDTGTGGASHSGAVALFVIGAVVLIGLAGGGLLYRSRGRA